MVQQTDFGLLRHVQAIAQSARLLRPGIMNLCLDGTSRAVPRIVGGYWFFLHFRSISFAVYRGHSILAEPYQATTFTEKARRGDHSEEYGEAIYH